MLILFDLGNEAEALECFNKAQELASSGLIKKLTEFASIEVEVLEITTDNEESISKALKLKKQGSISKSAGLKLLQKELISEAVDALDSKNNTTAAQFTEIFRQLEEGKKEKLAYNAEIRALRVEIKNIMSEMIQKQQEQREDIDMVALLHKSDFA